MSDVKTAAWITGGLGILGLVVVGLFQYINAPEPQPTYSMSGSGDGNAIGTGNTITNNNINPESDLPFFINPHAALKKEIKNVSFYEDTECTKELSSKYTGDDESKPKEQRKKYELIIKIKNGESKNLSAKADGFICTSHNISQENRYPDFEIDRDCCVKSKHQYPECKQHPICK